MKTVALILFLLCGTASLAATGNSLTDEQLLQIKFDQKLDSQVSPDLVFKDESGRLVHFGDYLGNRPVVLILGYYDCPMLCSLILDSATQCFRDLRWRVGKQFDVVFVSINPLEQPALAAERKKTYLRVYGRNGSASGWHFLTAAASPPQTGGAPQEDKSVQTLANEIGFRFAYDKSLKQYAHPSGLVILTPDGKVAHYLFGVTFSAKEIDAALRDADARKIGSPIQEFVLLCCEYSPFRGKYGKLVMDGVRVGGVMTVIGLGILLIRPSRPKLELQK